MLNNIIIFVLSAFVGTEVLSKVPQTLHTPLMSGANAISGITIVGALVAAGMAGADGGVWVTWIGFAALVVATINVVGGFLVTDRMLQMFAKKEPKAVEGKADQADLPSADGRSPSRAGAKKKATPFK
jgi:NAD(P) transhydrogenase subunit alpha